MKMALSPQHVFPPESWHMILSHLRRTRDLKNVSCSSKLFYTILRAKLWENPERFNQPKSFSDLQFLNALADQNVPIKNLQTHMFQFRCEKETKEISRVLKKRFRLSSLTLSSLWTFTTRQIKYFLKVPGLRINTFCFRCHLTRVKIDFLRGLGNCPRLMMDEELYSRLPSEEWERIVDSPIEIIAKVIII